MTSKIRPRAQSAAYGFVWRLDITSAPSPNPRVASSGFGTIRTVAAPGARRNRWRAMANSQPESSNDALVARSATAAGDHVERHVQQHALERIVGVLRRETRERPNHVQERAHDL